MDDSSVITAARGSSAPPTAPPTVPAAPRRTTGGTAAGSATATALGSARAALGRLDSWFERVLVDRLGITVRTPGRGGRIFLTTAGGAVVLLAFGSVVLSIGGGPAALRPHTPTATPAAAEQTARPRPPVTELSGPSITATHSYLLTSYASGSGHRSAVTTSSGQLPVGRQYQHLPRRGDDHLLTAEIVFPLLPASAACVSKVELRLTLLGTDGTPGDEAPYPLAAYPSALTGLATGTIPRTIPRLDLVANRPRGSIDWTRYGDPEPADAPAAAGGEASVGSPTDQAGSPAGQDVAPGQAAPDGPREVSADITELYQRWVAGMPTAEGKATVPPGTPLVLAVRPALTNVLGTWHHTYAGTATPTPPRLVWTRPVHCNTGSARA